MKKNLKLNFIEVKKKNIAATSKKKQGCRRTYILWCRESWTDKCFFYKSQERDAILELETRGRGRGGTQRVKGEEGRREGGEGEGRTCVVGRLCARRTHGNAAIFQRLAERAAETDAYRPS